MVSFKGHVWSIRRVLFVQIIDIRTRKLRPAVFCNEIDADGSTRCRISIGCVEDGALGQFGSFCIGQIPGHSFGHTFDKASISPSVTSIEDAVCIE